VGVSSGTLNLDTHVLIHALAGSLTRRERALLSSETFLQKTNRQTRAAQMDQRGSRLGSEWSQVIRRVRIWPLNLAVARAIAKLDFESDPADKIIAATSVVHRVPLAK
jgi:hypothetical protein